MSDKIQNECPSERAEGTPRPHAHTCVGPNQKRVAAKVPHRTHIPRGNLIKVSTTSRPCGAITPPKKAKKLTVSGDATSSKHAVHWKAPLQTSERPVSSYRLTVQLQQRSKVILLKALGKNSTKYTLTRKALVDAVQSLQTRGDIRGAYTFVVKVRGMNDAGAGVVAKSRLVVTR